MLISAMLGIDSRTTMDMDATIKGQPLSEESITSILNKIIKVNIDDGVKFVFKNIEQIREDDAYGGYRLSFDAIFDNMPVAFKIDITSGDKITPREIKYRFDLMLEDREIEILAYNLETIIAEKFETVIRRGVFNTRPRDYYDIYMLVKTQGKNIDNNVLKEAILTTYQYRNSIEAVNNANKEINILKDDINMQKQWKRYQNDNFYAENITYEQITESLYYVAKIL